MTNNYYKDYRGINNTFPQVVSTVASRTPKILIKLSQPQGVVPDSIVFGVLELLNIILPYMRDETATLSGPTQMLVWEGLSITPVVYSLRQHRFGGAQFFIFHSGGIHHSTRLRNSEN